MTEEAIAKRTPEESIAQSIVPYNRDDDKARYLGLRASGFTIREALKLIGKAHSTLSLWRQNEEFCSLETRLPEFRKELALEYTNLEFVRNYRLVLEKDYRVLYKSIHPDLDENKRPIPLLPQDHAYLLKMRSHYTPQQLEVIEALIRAESRPEGFDFTSFVIQAARITERIKIESRRSKSSGEQELLELSESNEA